jgi:hypothetical protein
MRTKDQIALEEVYSSIINESRKKPCCDDCKKKNKKKPCFSCDKKKEELGESFLADVSIGQGFIEAMSYWVSLLGAAAATAGAYNAAKLISAYKEKQNILKLLNSPEIKPLYDELKQLADRYKETKDMKVNIEHQKKVNEIKAKIADVIGVQAHGEDSQKYHDAVKDALSKKDVEKN